MAVDGNPYNPRTIVQEASFKLIFENAAVGIAKLDHNGHFLMANNKFCEITGYTKDELLQKTFQEFTHPDDLDADLKQAEALFHGDINSYSMEKRYIRKNGTVVWVKLTGSAIFDEQGKFNTFIGVVEDISEKKNAEAALRENENLLRVILENSHDGIHMLDLLTRRYVLMSPAQERLTGFSREELNFSMEEAATRLHPEDIANVDKYLAAVIAGKEPASPMEYRWQVKSGEYRWFSDSRKAVLNEKGEALALVGTSRDITELKKIETALRESEEKFRLLANNMSQLAWMMDNKGWIFWYNQRWFEYTGTTYEEMQGWGWQKVHHPNHVNRVVKSIKHSIESGEVFEELFLLRSKEGKYRWFLTRAIPLKDENGKIIRWFGTNTDVTHQQNIEKQLKNDSKLFEDLLYVAAHDLKGPVANMYGALNLMDRLPLEKKVMLLNRFRDIADQLNATIQGITEILGMRSEDKSAASVIHIEEVLDKVLQEFNSQLKQLTIQRNFEKPTISYIKLFLYSIINNLVSNALKFRREDVPLSIEITTQLKNEYTLLTIRDNGIGINLESYSKKLFLPFNRLQPKKTKGTGIGLYLIKGIIEKNGGYITVESTPGEGTQFNCYLKEY